MTWKHLCHVRRAPIVLNDGDVCAWCGTVQHNRWLTPTQAGKILGIRNTMVKQLAQDRRLLGACHSGLWRILRAHVECIAMGVMNL